MAKLTREEAAKKRYLAMRYKKARRILAMFYDKEDMQTSAGDCIADLMHLATAEGWDYWQAHESALSHHLAEQTGGQHG